MVCIESSDVVMDVASSKVRSGIPSKLLYAVDLILMAQTMEQLDRRVTEWGFSLLDKGLKANAENSSNGY